MLTKKLCQGDKALSQKWNSGLLASKVTRFRVQPLEHPTTPRTFLDDDKQKQQSDALLYPRTAFATRNVTIQCLSVLSIIFRYICPGCCAIGLASLHCGQHLRSPTKSRRPVSLPAPALFKKRASRALQIVHRVMHFQSQRSASQFLTSSLLQAETKETSRQYAHQ
jgi:hypothetical protein